MKYILLSLLVVFLGGCNSWEKEWDSETTEIQGRVIVGGFPDGVQLGVGDFIRISFEEMKKNRSFLVKFSDLHGKEVFRMSVNRSRLNDLKVKLPYSQEKLRLKKTSIRPAAIAHSQCYEGKGQVTVTFCFGGPDFSLWIGKLNGQPLLELQGGAVEKFESAWDTVTTLKLSEAIERALSRNLRSLYELETVAQAQQNALAAKLNLLPHFRFSTAVALGTMALPPLISAFGDWTPFLFPTRWFKEKQSRETAFAIELGYQVMRANLAQEVHSLSYSLKHSVNKKILLQETQDRIRNLIAHIEGWQIDPIIIHTLEACAQTLDLEISQADGVIGTEKAALALSLGFMNPKAVEEILIDEALVPIEEGSNLDAKSLTQKSIEASRELQQIRFIVEALKAKKLGAAFSWLDPSGSSERALGFNLVPQLKSVKSEIKQAMIKREMVQQQIHQSVDAVIRAASRAHVNYREILETIEVQERGIQRLMERLKPGMNSNTLELTFNKLIELHKEKLALEFQLESEIYRWEQSQIRVERLLFEYPKGMDVPLL